MSMSCFQEIKPQCFAHALTVQNGPKNFVSEENQGWSNSQDIIKFFPRPQTNSWTFWHCLANSVSSSSDCGVWVLLWNRHERQKNACHTLMQSQAFGRFLCNIVTVKNQSRFSNVEPYIFPFQFCCISAARLELYYIITQQRLHSWQLERLICCGYAG
jgi:hypothetical protein